MPDRDDQGAPGARDLLALEMRRRTAYRLVFGAAAAAMVAPGAGPRAAGIGLPQFLHGVASGDPERDGVLIWTRVTPPTLDRVEVQWRVATSPDMSGVVASGQRNAAAARDFTVKVEVDGLQPGTTYYYQFSAGGVTSPVGTTRTLPASSSSDPFSVAFFSCSNYEKGYFNAYAEAARESGLSAILHLGDYIYEYGVGGYLTPAFASVPASTLEPRQGQLQPPVETVMLDAYRMRHALYKTDQSLQALHAKLPWIVIYDDHESANDAWTGGAENHQPATEGDWQARKLAALQAFYEWMPIREPRGRRLVDPATGNPTGLYRSFRFGRVANLIMLDTRLAGRDQQLGTTALLGAYANPAANDVVGGRPRSLLGAAQEAWLDDQLARSRQTWQIIGNQVLAFYQNAADYQSSSLFTDVQKAAISAAIDGIFGTGAGAQFAQLGIAGAPNPAAADSWTGYPSARARLNASLAKAANPVVLSGDSHNAWAANLAGVGAGGRTPLGVEFGCSSVTSPGYEQYFVGFPPQALSALFVQSSQVRSPLDRLVYADTSRRGYVRLDVSRETLRATFVFIDSVASTAYTADRSRQFTVPAGARQIAASA